MKRWVAILMCCMLIGGMLPVDRVHAESSTSADASTNADKNASEDASKEADIKSSIDEKINSEESTGNSDASVEPSVSTSSDASIDASSNASSNASTEVEFSVKSKVDNIYLTAHGKNKVVVSWDKIWDASVYLVYKKNPGASKYSFMSICTKNKYTDILIKYGKTYGYKVVPVKYVASTDASRDGAELISADASVAASFNAKCLVSSDAFFDIAVKPQKTGIVYDISEASADAYMRPGVIIVGKAKTISFKNAKVVSTDHQKYTYSEMVSDIKLLKKNYHGIVDYKIFGKSEDNRGMYDVIVGNPKAKKCIMVVAALHAREYMTTLVSMAQIEYYLQNYYGKIDGKKVSGTLNNICIHYVPMANPDGVSISQSGFNVIRNKTLRKKLKKMPGISTQWKSNARGVDLNRNYAFQFLKRGIRGQEGYSGSKATSESETKAISKLIKNLKSSHGLKGAVNYHTMGSIIFGDIKPSAAAAKYTKKMDNVAKKTTGYVSSGSVGYTSTGHGNLREYFMYSNKVPSITLELGRYCNPVPMNQYKGIWSKNKNLVLREARIFV